MDIPLLRIMTVVSSENFQQSDLIWLPSSSIHSSEHRIIMRKLKELDLNLRGLKTIELKTALLRVAIIKFSYFSFARQSNMSAAEAYLETLKLWTLHERSILMYDGVVNASLCGVSKYLRQLFTGALQKFVLKSFRILYNFIYFTILLFFKISCF